jgi:acyl-CoA synthetase (AMP-forming)/AMP-acid ligase II
MKIVARDTLVDVVCEQADTRGKEIWLRYLVTGDVSGPINELTYGELEQRARAIASELLHHASPGDRALLVFPPGIDFVTAMFGCLFAGIVPVPAYPPGLAKPERSIAKLHAIVGDCTPCIALTSTEFLSRVSRVVPPGIHLVATDTCRESMWRPPEINADTIALLQYTSGSTGAPKGVVLRHRHLIANQFSIEAGMGPVGLVVGWLPMYHDMGLIGNLFQSLYAGTGLVLMSPVAFLKRPARWLEAISHFRATTSGGPNFAYDLCTQRVTDEVRSLLDLSSWRVAFCGAEPIRDITYRNFTDRFASRGFSRSSFYPCYGLAEASLFVTGKRRDETSRSLAFRNSALERGEVELADGDTDARVLTSCGMPSPGDEVLIVDPERCIPAMGVGEIWVRGPGVASGYWGRDSDDVFRARLADGDGPFLRTGDLGFLHGGELFVAGRYKDLIILAGRNLFPQDIEAVIEDTVPTIRRGHCAAFSIDQTDGEKLCIAAEYDAHAATVASTITAIKQAVAEQCEAAVFEVLLVKKGELPKTSSGKLERYACRKLFRSKS